jgi:ABC-type glycerol-3-phosphate transport system substrate-binding protein
MRIDKRASRGKIRGHSTVIHMVVLLLAVLGCTKGDRRDTGSVSVIVVFKHGKIAGDLKPFRELLDRFEREHPRIRVKDETLSASTDEQHQFYAINLESKSAGFDVLSLDVIWVPQFAREGLRDVGHLLAEGE